MRRRLYFVGQGISSWRDPRNWALEEGGKPLRHLHARGNDHVIVCGADGHQHLDLRDMPHGALEIRGYTGQLRLPNGDRLSLVPTRRARLRARIRRELEPIIPPSFIAAVDMAGGWRRAVLDRLASLGITPRGAVLMPAISGGSGFVQVTCNASDNGADATKAATVVNAPAAGNTLLLSFAGASENITPSSCQLSSVADSKGNTWVIDKTANGTTAPCVSIARTTQDVGTLTTSDTITVTVSQVGGTDAYIFAVHEIAGLATVAAVDVTASAVNTTNVTTRSAGTTSATANAVEFIWAAFAVNNNETGLTAGAGYSQPSTKFYAAGSISIEFEYKTTSSTGTQNPTASGGVSGHQRGVCVAYKMLTAVTQTAALPYEAPKGVTATASEPYDSPKGIAQTAAQPYEAPGGIRATAAGPYEAPKGVTASASKAYEALGGIRATAAEPYEAPAGIRLTVIAPYDVLQGLTVADGLPYETVRALAATGALPYETLLARAATASLAFEALRRLAVTDDIPIETLARLAVLDSLPYETMASLAATGAFPFDAPHGLAADGPLVYESLAGRTAIAQLPVEALAAIALELGLPYETLAAAGRVVATAVLPYEVLEQITATGILPYETHQGLFVGVITATDSPTAIVIVIDRAAATVEATDRPA